MLEWAYPGRKVVCVRDDFLCKNGEVLPCAGQIYTIRAVELQDGVVFIRLVEFVNTPRAYDNGYCECAFDVIGFRPVLDRKMDISSLEVIISSLEVILYQQPVCVSVT